MSELIISWNDLAKIIGKQIKKENVEDSFFEVPSKRATQIVVPDLEIPGKIAMD